MERSKWGEIWSVFGTVRIRPTALFWTFCSLFKRYLQRGKRWGKKCSRQGVKEQRQKQYRREERNAVDKAWKNKGRNNIFCSIRRQKMTDESNAAEFPIGWAYQIGDVSFHGQVTIRCNTRSLTELDMGTDALPIVTESGKEKEKDLDFLFVYR